MYTLLLHISPEHLCHFLQNKEGKEDGKREEGTEGRIKGC